MPSLNIAVMRYGVYIISYNERAVGMDIEIGALVGVVGSQEVGMECLRIPQVPFVHQIVLASGRVQVDRITGVEFQVRDPS